MATADAATTAAEGSAMAATDHSADAAAEPHAAPEGAIFMAPDNHVMDDAHHAPAWVKVSPFVAMLIGLFTAWVFYIRDPSIPGRLAAQQRPLYEFLLNKWYFDEIYDFLFVRPAKRLGNFLWKRGDGGVIDGFLNGVAMGVVPFFTRLAGRMQSGYLFHYAFAMVLGILILITWMTIGGGAH
jgi:NADH-quinone oxidoreductase subunit L